ncbi:MAG TPA: S41 family peptidase [Pyrinomonadaceae bacterium]|nr:S41 family peptidase [Pyrinomonadaceae bacterium]
MRLLSRIFPLLIVVMVASQALFAQAFDRIERERFKSMLNNIKNAVKKNYYDTNYHGIDVDARFQKAQARLDEVTSTGQANAVIAQALIDFNDSHLYYLPPPTTVDVQYGFRIKMIGDGAFVTSVKPKSDAEKKGLKAGDRILSFEGFNPSRKELWKMIYFYYTLSPRTKVRLGVVHANSTEPVEIEVAAKMTQKKRTLDLTNYFDVNDLLRDIEDSSRDLYYLANAGNTAMWKLVTWAAEPTEIAAVMQSKITKDQNLILDLRGNGGGYVKSLEAVSGYFFEKDMKIADRKGRPDQTKENQPMMLKGKGPDAFKGKLIVLIDSQSGSASEIFARLIQIEKRGIVLGDVSAGAVMQSIRYPFTLVAGIDREVYYAASVTNADVIMSDGKSVEHVGVIPDELIIPTGSDLLAGHDPVLARALELLGTKTTSAEAGKVFERANRWEDN